MQREPVCSVSNLEINQYNSEEKNEKSRIKFYFILFKKKSGSWINKSDSLESNTGKWYIVLAAIVEALNFTNMTLARKPRGSIN